jgi:hypothetical protein
MAQVPDFIASLIEDYDFLTIIENKFLDSDL